MRKDKTLKMSDKIQEYQIENGFDAWEFQERTPVSVQIQTHLDNLKNTFGEQTLRNVIKNMGLNRKTTKKAG